MADKPAFEAAEWPHPRLIVGAVVGFFLFAVVVMGILLAIYVQFEPQPVRPAAFPQPDVQSYPHADLHDFLKAERRKLRRAGWVDKAKGVAAIPVDKAMEIIAGRGKAAFDPIPEIAQAGGATEKAAGR